LNTKKPEPIKEEEAPKTEDEEKDVDMKE